MNIINSDIITSKYDTLWQDTAAVTGQVPEAPVLIVTSTFPTDGNDEMQLQKMMDACKLSAGQYNIVRLRATEEVAWHKLREHFGPKVVFLIGVQPAQLGISAIFRFNVPNHFGDSVWLPTLSVSELDKHPDVKKQLWTGGMKPVFVDKSFGEW